MSKTFLYRTCIGQVLRSPYDKILHVQLWGWNKSFRFKVYLGRVRDRSAFRDAVRQCFYGLCASVPGPESISLVLETSTHNR